MTYLRLQRFDDVVWSVFQNNVHEFVHKQCLNRIVGNFCDIKFEKAFSIITFTHFISLMPLFIDQSRNSKYKS